MKKNISLLDFTIWWIPWNQYVDWAELKHTLWIENYIKLLRYINTKHVHCPLEWLPIEILQEFLHKEI